MGEGVAAGGGPSGPAPQQPPRGRELTLEMPPTPTEAATASSNGGADKHKQQALEAAAATNGGAVVTGSVRKRGGDARLLGDSMRAGAEGETRPPCYLEKASLWSVLTFGYVRACTRTVWIFRSTRSVGCRHAGFVRHVHESPD